ncbi:MAG: DNA-protecting protein DprA [Angelakisella sp.]|jgi:DNA processing protein|nr:DNA-protecting protein DprA [Angelakisella sp.]
MEAKLPWLRFQRAFGYGTTRSQKLLTRFGHPSAIFEKPLGQLARSGVFTPVEMRNLAEAATEEAARRILDFCADYGCDILTPDDPEYPQRLREIYGYPAVLYVRGSLEGLDETLAIAMVGTRNITDYGLRAANTITRELAEKGVAIVSGLARGIDTACHTAALKAGGRTIAVLGCGIDVVYPPENAQLEELIVRYGGAVVTEFPPGEQPVRFHFPIRNRVISGLSNGVVVVEGTRRSGSLITAGHAFAQNRDVFAVPGSIFSSASSGPNYLLSQNAKAVESAESILEEYECLIQWEPRQEEEEGREKIISRKLPSSFEESEKNGYNDGRRSQKADRPAREEFPAQQPLPAYLSETQQKVYSLLAEGGVQTADYIVAQSGLPIAQVLAALTQMEIFGLVRTHSGRRFSL